jgi:hypothetical protein
MMSVPARRHCYFCQGLELIQLTVRQAHAASSRKSGEREDLGRDMMSSYATQYKRAPLLE